MPNGRPYDSPLNKLADALPTFLLQMQNMKMRQEEQEALNSYRQGMLAQTIQRNEMMQTVRDEQRRLGVIERGREVREEILAARAKYGEPGARAIYPEATARYFPQGLPPEPEKEIKPTAGNIAYARRQRDKFQESITDANKKIEQMRRDLNLGLGEQPITPGGIGKKKEQASLDNWNRLHKTRDKAKASLDSLIQASKARGIDLEYGAPAPEQIKDMSDEEVLQMIGVGVR